MRNRKRNERQKVRKKRSFKEKDIKINVYIQDNNDANKSRPE